MRVTPSTDDAAPEVVLRELRDCAACWEPGARLLGNVRAGDIVRAIDSLLDQATSPAEPPAIEFGDLVTWQKGTVREPITGWSLPEWMRYLAEKKILQIERGDQVIWRRP